METLPSLPYSKHSIHHDKLSSKLPFSSSLTWITGYTQTSSYPLDNWYTQADLDTLKTPDPPATIWTWKVEQFTILTVNYWYKYNLQICPVCLRQACFFQLCQLIASTYQSCPSYKPVHSSGSMLAYISRFCFVLQACSSHFLTLPGHLCQNIIFCRSMVGPLIIASQKFRYSSLSRPPPIKYRTGKLQ